MYIKNKFFRNFYNLFFFFFLNEFGHLSYLIHKNKFQMDLNMISILTGLDEKKRLF